MKIIIGLGWIGLGSGLDNWRIVRDRPALDELGCSPEPTRLTRISNRSSFLSHREHGRMLVGVSSIEHSHLTQSRHARLSNPKKTFRCP